MYSKNPEGTQVIVRSMNMEYIADTARYRTHKLFRPKREPIPLCHNDGPCPRFDAPSLIFLVAVGLTPVYSFPLRRSDHRVCQNVSTYCCTFVLTPFIEIGSMISISLFLFSASASLSSVSFDGIPMCPEIHTTVI